jgi:hypothetical protein
MTVKVKRKWGIKWLETLFLKYTNGRKKGNNESECTGKFIFIYYRCKPKACQWLFIAVLRRKARPFKFIQN